MLTDFWSNPRQCNCSSNSSFKWKGVSALLFYPPPPPLPPSSSSTTTATPQSTRCIVKKWEGTLEPSCSMKVGCSVCLLMRWKEDGSEKWNKVKEHIRRRKKTIRASFGGKQGERWKTLSPLFWTSFEVQVRNLRKVGKGMGLFDNICNAIMIRGIS